MSPELESQIAAAAAALKAEGATEVYVFGSATTGRFTEHSDLDLAARGIPANNFYHAAAQASNAVDRFVDLIDIDDVHPKIAYLHSIGAFRRVA